MTILARHHHSAACAVALLLTLAACGTMPSDPTADPAPPGTTATTAMPSAGAPAGPSPQPYPTGSAGTPRGPLTDPKQVDGQDPDAVTRAALTVMYTIDTTIDTTPHDATIRATPYLSDAYAAALRNHQAMTAPGAQWQTWTEHHAYTTVALQPAEDPGRPSDTATTAYRHYQITTTAHGDDGWTAPGTTAVAFVQLSRATAGAPWRIATLRIT